MANKVLIQILASSPIILEAPCTEDIVVDAKSQYSSFGELVPSMETLTNFVSTAYSSIGGTVQRGVMTLKNALDVPRWIKTDPARLALDMNFYIKTNPYTDVWLPTMLLLSMQILSRNNANEFITPGMSINAMNAFQDPNSSERTQSKEKSPNLNEKASATDDIKNLFKSLPTKAKLCSVYIPGIIYLPLAYVEVAQPTWSKQITEKGYPLWSKVQLQLTGLYPAVAEDNFFSVNPREISSSIQTVYADAINNTKSNQPTGQRT